MPATAWHGARVGVVAVFLASPILADDARALRDIVLARWPKEGTVVAVFGGEVNPDEQTVYLDFKAMSWAIVHRSPEWWCVGRDPQGRVFETKGFPKPVAIVDERGFPPDAVVDGYFPQFMLRQLLESGIPPEECERADDGSWRLAYCFPRGDRMLMGRLVSDDSNVRQSARQDCRRVEVTVSRAGAVLAVAHEGEDVRRYRPRADSPEGFEIPQESGLFAHTPHRVTSVSLLPPGRAPVLEADGLDAIMTQKRLENPKRVPLPWASGASPAGRRDPIDERRPRANGNPPWLLWAGGAMVVGGLAAWWWRRRG